MDSNKHEMYRLLHDAYFGDGMFRDGTALVRHERESQNNYARRKKLAYYLNYTGPIIDGSVAPIFKDDIRRDYKDTFRFKVFIEDVDRLGTSLQNFIRRQATLAKLYGVVYIIVDNASDFGVTDADNIEQRTVPFLQVVLPQNVTSWHFDERGLLDEFSYRVVTRDVDGKHTKTWKWTNTTWTQYDESGEVLKQGEHNIKRIPVVQWFGRDTEPMRILPAPEFLAIAQANNHIYHLCSLLSQISDNQTFNILTMQANNDIDSVTIGTNNLLVYPSDVSNPPSFIAPDSGPATVLMNQIDRIVNEMYRMSGINSVIGVESAKSGVAKEWEFERTNQRLVDFALQCEKAEKDIIALYEAWAGEVIDYSCEYPRDFKISDVSACLTEAQQALDLGFNSTTYRLEVAKKVLASYMANIDPDVYDEIVSDLESSEAEMEQLKASQMQGLINAAKNVNNDGGAVDGANGNGQDNQSV